MKTVKITSEKQTELYNWIENHKESNWGGWVDFPELPVGAKFLQYDNTPVVVKFDAPVLFINHTTGESISCRYVSANRRCPGAKAGEFAIASQLKPAGQVENDRYRCKIRDYYRAKLAQATQNLWDASEEWEKNQILRIHAELDAIKGTPNSKMRRLDLEVRLSNDIQRPTPLTEWMEEALRFDSAEDYANSQTKK